MSSTLLEVTRAGHEEVERLERLIVKDLQNEPASSKDRLFQNHRVRNMIDEITSTTLKLVEIYEDKDSARKDEIAALGGQTATGTNVFSAFYDRLKEIREYHRRHPAARVVDVNEEYEELLKEEPRIEFTGEALAALGLKTGGTIQQRAERLFLTKHTPLEQLDRKHFAKGSRVSEQNANTAAPQQAESSKEIALMEAKMKKLCDLLQETIVRTKENVEKKQALTYEEMEAEREEEEVQADTESDDDEQQIYNPLKLPMGWDGKPIPYWLYKLHGLGQEFKCEICGNHSYWGRRAYERHFKEWRHQHGMRCLGIPNTKNFNEITSIEEAKQLWERIQERQGVNKWRPDLEEEYEDKEGNIYNKKTYTDLQRQGLI
ncbi:hypothetical protein TEA_028115 [Camellia sinensis var. sinensis]|uniref:Matrin-type domain-containing protein n=1 Tax=Camellia sinensis var. sinensis TaxID=542762 RepID=A0A4S4E3K9_CAMSN|nr:hypothetical protein TEA_028115 [Camellia sinensis var. sinensis]